MKDARGVAWGEGALLTLRAPFQGCLCDCTIFHFIPTPIHQVQVGVMPILQMRTRVSERWSLS